MSILERIDCALGSQSLRSHLFLTINQTVYAVQVLPCDPPAVGKAFQPTASLLVLYLGGELVQ
jgi:hypothetical protein